MSTGKRILIGVVGGVFLGIAMEVGREYTESIWLRSAIAGIGGLGLGVAIVFAQRKSQAKEK